MAVPRSGSCNEGLKGLKPEAVVSIQARNVGSLQVQCSTAKYSRVEYSRAEQRREQYRCVRPYVTALRIGPMYLPETVFLQ